MRRGLLTLVLLLLPEMGWAQAVGTPPYMQFFSISGTGSFTGGSFTSPLLSPAADNCAAVPYSFTGDTNTGVCSAAADTVGFITGGTTRFSLTTTTATTTLPIKGPDGSAATPTYNFTINGNLGMYQSSSNVLGFATGGTARWLIGSGGLQPAAADTFAIGAAAAPITSGYIGRSIEGSKTKTLVETSATTFVTVAVPQTAAANFAGGEVIYTVYESDGTDSTTLSGRAKFAAVNKAGTESCAAIADVQTAAISTGAFTLTCVMTCVTGLADVVGLAMNCTDAGSMTQTILNIRARLDMPQINTLVFP